MIGLARQLAGPLLRPARAAAVLVACTLALVACSSPSNDGKRGGDAARMTSLTGTVWVANEAGNSVSVIDAATGRVVTTYTNIAGPHNLQLAGDGETAWVASGHLNLVARIDVARAELTGTAWTGRGVAHVIETPDARQVWHTNAGDGTVGVFDARSLKRVATLRTGASPHGLRPSPDGTLVMVANMGATSVTLVDPPTRTTTSVDVGGTPVQVAFSPAGRYGYVTLNDRGELARVDMRSRTVDATVEVGDGPVQVYASSDGRYVLVANQGTEDDPSDTVSVVDARTFTVVKTLTTDDGAHGVVIDPTGSFAFVTNTFADTVSVLDLERLEVIGRIEVGDAPNGISFSPLAPRMGWPRTVELPLPAPSHGEDDHGHEEH